MADPVLVQLCLKCVQSSPLHRPSFEQIHQVLLCEFIRRTVARTIINSERREETENVPPRTNRLISSPKSRITKPVIIHLDSGSVSGVDHEDYNNLTRRNPPRSGRSNTKPAPKKTSRRN
jgi:hypothetical protein